MKRLRTLAAAQIVLGLSGLALIGFLYMRFGGELQAALGRLDLLAGDAQMQAAIGDELLDDWKAFAGEVDVTLTAHQRAVKATQNTTQRVAASIAKWQQSLSGFSTVAGDTGEMLTRVSSQLPIRIPKLEYERKQLEFVIPQFETREQTVNVPYPTANVGSRKVNIDLGLTDFDFEVPTLGIQTKGKKVIVPATPKITERRESISVPSNFAVTHQEFFADEKQLLEKSSAELKTVATLLQTTSLDLDAVRDVVSTEVAQSMEATAHSLAKSQASIRQSYQNHIPAFQLRLRDQQVQLQASQSTFRKLDGLVPWLFLVAALLPMAIVLHGLSCWLRARGET